MILPFAFVFGVCVASVKKEPAKYFFDIAISIDQSGNTVCKYLFDVILIKRNGVIFGNPDLTISGILGQNKEAETLTLTGKLLAYLLDKIQKNHVKNSIGK